MENSSDGTHGSPPCPLIQVATTAAGHTIAPLWGIMETLGTKICPGGCFALNLCLRRMPIWNVFQEEEHRSLSCPAWASSLADSIREAAACSWSSAITPRRATHDLNRNHFSRLSLGRPCWPPTGNLHPGSRARHHGFLRHTSEILCCRRAGPGPPGSCHWIPSRLAKRAACSGS